MDDMRVLSGLALLFLLLVLVFSEVHDAADWRLRRRSDLDQILFELVRELKGSHNRNDPELLGIRANDTYFRYPDLLVYADSFLDNPLLR
jgi:hypothetical protein